MTRGRPLPGLEDSKGLMARTARHRQTKPARWHLAASSLYTARALAIAATNDVPAGGSTTAVAISRMRVTRSPESVTALIGVARFTWALGHFYRPDLARAGGEPGRNRYRGQHQRVEV